MRFLTILYILLLHQNAYSFNFNDLRNLFTTLNEVETKVGGESGRCCDPTVEELEDINQCAIDLCGESGSFESVFISDQDYEDNYKNPEITKDYEAFKPKLQKYLDQVRENTIKEIKEMKEIKSNLKANNSNYFNIDTYTDGQIAKAIYEELGSLMQMKIKKDSSGNKELKVFLGDSASEIDEEIVKQYISYQENIIKTQFINAIYAEYLELDEAMIFF